MEDLKESDAQNPQLRCCNRNAHSSLDAHLFILSKVLLDNNVVIIGFTGTRLGSRPAQTDAIRRFLAHMKPRRLVHGGAPGCDMIAHGIAESLGVPEIEIHPATYGRSVVVWEGMGGHCIIYPPLPPLDRNRVIVSRVQGLLACPQRDEEDWGSGTWATIRYAREAGMPIYLCRSDGRIIRDEDPIFAI